ncbi:C39 family peptidase [Candidatus Falkowbacteria bacterium]|nr:C39 family peptidase [Candidatus Falkowbacteria bacterium]
MPKRIFFIFSIFLLVLAGCGPAQNVENFGVNQGDTVALNTPSAGAGDDTATADLGSRLKDTVKTTVQKSQEAVNEIVADVKPQHAVEGLPETFDQDMAFARQAPFGAWDVAFYQDGCEEASLVMAQKFFAGLALDEKIMKEELDTVAPWELERFGQNLSVDTEAVAAMAREYFNMDAEVSSDVTVERIKQELVAGNLVILPLTGQEIDNPNFTGVGPLYHMLVVKGYDRDQFITNDPGTRLGEDYKYPYDVLIEATHDWNGGDIYNGERVMLIVKKSM